MRQAVFRALVAGQTSNADALEQLKDLLRDMPNVKEEQNERWTDWPVLSSVELNAIAKSIQGVRIGLDLSDWQTSAQQANELLVGEPNNDIQSLVDLGSLGSSRFPPSAVFSALTAWLSKSWTHTLSPEVSEHPTLCARLTIRTPVRVSCSLLLGWPPCCASGIFILRSKSRTS
jgi:hypothetical protein